MAANELKAIVSDKSNSNIQIKEAAASGLLTYNDKEDPDIDPKKYKCVKYSCVLTTLILIGFAIFTIYNAVNNGNDPSLPAKCETDSCYKLAADILNTVNESVDPCENFYNYVCDGWREDNEWKLIENRQYGTFQEMDDEQKEVFLSVFTENTDPLQSYDVVNKAKIFFDSCYDSEILEEDLDKQSIILEFINMVNFSDFDINSGNSQNWTVNISRYFQKAMSWTIRRQWQDLFSINAVSEGIILIQQQKEWAMYSESYWRTLMHYTFIPLYQRIFGLTAQNASFVADLVIEFMNKVYEITTAHFLWFDDFMIHRRNTTISQLDELFGRSDILNYKQIIKDLFYCSSSDCVQGIAYYEPGIKYFNDLIDIIESTPPFVIQYFFVTNVLYKYFAIYVPNSNQPRHMDRTDFCFWLTRLEFTYIYGFVINQKLYSSEKYKLALDITNRVKNDGIIELMNKVHWLDTYSLNNSLLKANKMDSYVGLPPQITNVTYIRKYYDEPTVNKVSENLGFVENYALMKEFDVDIHMRIFQGEDVLLHLPWPSIFHTSDYFGLWLTGVNAFYSPRSIESEKANFLCMPQTITQNPLFDVEYPTLVNFATYGVIVGHEITHGFDSSGSTFDWFGNEIEMWTNETRQLYNKQIDCFIQQYSNIEVEPNIFCNGELTKTENTADNGGMTAALKAYEVYKRQYSDEQNDDETRPALPGLEYTDEQLWWISYARTWCNVFRPGYYNTSNYYHVHAPKPARVNGIVQNFPQFAGAFNCPVGSPMNPEAKCGLWHDP